MLADMWCRLLLRPGCRRLLLACLVLACPAAPAQQSEDWFDDDAETRARAVNEGDLVFVGATPAGRVLRTRNRLLISPQSLDDGWVGLEQCQENLDPVPALEVVYRYDAMRDLRIDSFQGMEHTWVEDGSVQMVDVGEGAAICMSAEVRILRALGDGRYELRSGPFHRRFLDGYYPLHLDYRVTWPAERLVLESVEPSAQPELAIAESAGALHLDALFEGRLTVRLVLRLSSQRGRGERSSPSN